MKDKRIGFIGLGAMGKPMARHLVAAGYPLCVYDLKPEPVDELVEIGAEKRTSAADAARDADVVITILPADDQVKTAVLGINGVLETIRPGAVLIDMTSLNLHTSILVAGEAEKKGVKFLDAARTEKVPLFMAAQVYQLLSLASSGGLGNLDFSSVIEILEEKAGVKVRVPS
jgi:3-hydroxyisobutyrate dehydrogenase-like beta-hydroxyacid dehydrogenase